MGFFNNESEHTTTHCHSTQPTDQQKDNIDCCELVYSNEYFTNRIDIQNNYKAYVAIVISIDDIKNIEKTNPEKITIINNPPWWKTDNKYNNFSDLVWIVVNTI